MLKFTNPLSSELMLKVVELELSFAKEHEESFDTTVVTGSHLQLLAIALVGLSYGDAALARMHTQEAIHLLLQLVDEQVIEFAKKGFVKVSNETVN